MTTEEQRNRLRRLRLLQRLAEAHPNPRGEFGLLARLRTDPELTPTVARVRQSLRYLAGHNLVALITLEGTDWLAGRITDQGRTWLNTPADAGLAIYSPQEKPEPAAKTTRGRISSVKTLPTEVKAWLDQELVRRHFTGYVDLAELLASQGYEISKSALGRYGKRFKAEQDQLRQSIEMAKAFAEVVGDDGAALNQTLTALAQQELMSVIREGRYDDADIKLPALIQSIAQLNRQNIATLKFQIAEAARTQALKEAASAVEEAARQQGLTAEQAEFWRTRVLGVGSG